jgi:hypothetical protein
MTKELKTYSEDITRQKKNEEWNPCSREAGELKVDLCVEQMDPHKSVIGIEVDDNIVDSDDSVHLKDSARKPKRKPTDIASKSQIDIEDDNESEWKEDELDSTRSSSTIESSDKDSRYGTFDYA